MPIESATQTSFPATYEIQFRGQIDERRMRWFEGMQMQHMPDGCTLLSGLIPDQSALYGILGRIHALGLDLLSVRRI